MSYRFIHIPKTGGSTFRKNVENSNLKEPIKMGHEVRYDLNSKNITFIRDPINRTISHYNEMRNNTTKKLQLNDWFREKYWNFQTKWLLDKLLKSSELNEKSFSKIRKLLKGFFFVGITENLDKDLEVLFKKMNISKNHQNLNVAKKRYVPTKEELQLIKLKNDYDIRLYTFVKNESKKMSDLWK